MTYETDVLVPWQDLKKKRKGNYPSLLPMAFPNWFRGLVVLKLAHI